MLLMCVNSQITSQKISNETFRSLCSNTQGPRFEYVAHAATLYLSPLSAVHILTMVMLILNLAKVYKNKVSGCTSNACDPKAVVVKVQSDSGECPGFDVTWVICVSSSSVFPC